jgi:tRNA(Ile)-lysidine synthase
MAALAMPALVTAHTLDDQAETLLMRLARGSGLDGLAAMAPRGVLPSDGPDSAAGDGPLILRPLLAVAKARLRATLEARGIPWAEDPSNEMAAFERSRLRAGRGQLDGLGLTSDMLALSARRLRRARAALDAIATSLCAAPGGLVRTDPVGVLAVDCRRLSDAPKEIALRIIGRCIQAAGGSGEPVPLTSLEVIVEAVHGRPGHAAGTWTLARARISAAADAIQFEREPGRLPLPRMAVQAGTRAVWDGRFAITVADGLGPSIEVQALGAAGVRELRRLGRTVRGGSPQQLVPSFWQEGHLLAVPALGFWASEELEPRLAARFLGLRYNSPLPDSDLSGDFPGV